MARKVYVEVTAHFDIEGRITPLSLVWEDGTVFEIDRVTNCLRAASLGRGNWNAVHRPNQKPSKLSIL